MVFSTGFHLKTIYGAIVGMTIAWAGGMAWSFCEHKELTRQISEVRYDNGIRLASIETSLKQISLSLIEIKRDVKSMNEKALNHTGNDDDAQQE